MYRYLLSKKFFEDNPIKGLTSQRLIYSSMLMPEVDDLARKIVTGLTDRAEEEALRINGEKDPEVLLKLLRSKCDPINYAILREKVLEHEEELMPKIVEMLISSGNDVFIEHAARIIPRCKVNYSNDLLHILKEIRNPYALSLMCIVIGFIGEEEVIPIIHHNYTQLKGLYMNENYEQGPLLALAELNARFYKQKS